MLFTFVSIDVYAQEIYNLNKHLVQPEFSSFERPSEPNVDSQGNLNITIPIGVVSGRGIDFPINFTYHSGIKVLAPSSWIGLGWNFNSGYISRQPVIAPYTKESNNKSGVDIFDGIGNNNAPDIFTISIPGKGSVKMVQIKNTNYSSNTLPQYQTDDFMTLDHKAWKIEYKTSIVTVDGVSTGERPNTNVGYDHHSVNKKADFSKFLITVEDGTSYLFESPTLAYVDVNEKINSVTYLIRQDYVSTWRLVAIFGNTYAEDKWTTPLASANGEWVKLEYQTVKTASHLPRKHEYRQTQYLDKIITPTGSAKFNTSSRYEPMLDDWEKGPNYTNDTQVKLTSIVFKESNSVTKTAILIQDQSFNPMPNGSTAKGRLKLKEIQIQAYNNSSLPGYKFEYHSNPNISWPYGKYHNEMTACIDDFGYYNYSNLGWVNSTYSSRCTGTANNANSGSEAWSISSIEYPTGLKESFEYETRSIPGYTKLEYYMPEMENMVGEYKPKPNASGNEIVYVGGPRVKNITEDNGFDIFSGAEHYYREYEYKGVVGISGIPSSFLKYGVYNGSYNLGYSTNNNSSEIYYERVDTYYGVSGQRLLNGPYDFTYYTVDQNPISLVSVNDAPCPVHYIINDPFITCMSTYLWQEEVSSNWGQEIDKIYYGHEQDGFYTKSSSTHRLYTIAGTSDAGASNHLWSINLVESLTHPQLKTIELKQMASRVSSRHDRDGEKIEQIAYRYDKKTNLVSQEVKHIRNGSYNDERIAKITRAHEISEYSALKQKNMLTQVARYDIGYRAIGDTTWHKSNVTTWKDFGTNSILWKPWKSFSWESSSVSGSPVVFNAWSNGNKPPNWLLNEEKIEYDVHGNIKEIIFSNLTKVKYSYDGVTAKLTSVNIHEGGSPNPEVLGISLEYDYPIRNLSKITNQKGVSTSYSYDEHGRLIGISNHKGKLISSYQYEYGLTFESEFKTNRIIETIYTNPSNSSQNIKSYKYFDGLARLRQSVTETEGGFNVTHFDFNPMGFTEKVWNPYLDQITVNGSLVRPTDARTRATAYYKTKLGLTYSPHPYKRSEYFNKSLPVTKKMFPSYTNIEENTEILFPFAITQINGQSVYTRERVDESGNRVSTYYNDLGELVRSSIAENVSSLKLRTDYEYDKVGNLVKTISPKGLETTYTYNSLGQLTSKKLPDQDDSMEYRYDNAGNLRFVRDANHKSKESDTSISLSGNASVITSIVRGIEAPSKGKLSLDFCVYDLFYDDYDFYIKNSDTHAILYIDSFSAASNGGCVGNSTPLTFEVEPGVYHFTGIAQNSNEPIMFSIGTLGFISDDVYTYTKYDKLNRPTETGEYNGGLSFTSVDPNDAAFPTSGHNAHIKYYYSGNHAPIISGYAPNNANGRLTKISYRNQNTPSGWSHEAFSYNDLGLVEWKILDLRTLNTKKLIRYNYDDFGRLIRTDYQPTSSTDRFITWNEYDNYGRLKYVYTDTDTVVSGRKKDIEFVYDGIGNVKERRLGHSAIQKVDYSYTIRGWLDQINDINNIGSDKFAMKLNYAANGNITQQQWKQPGLNNNLASYLYSYDAANRLKGADFTGSGYNSNAYKLYNLNYDKDGNIIHYMRNTEFGYPDGTGYMEVVLTSSNRINFLRDGAIYTEYDVDYDANGNMTKNELNGLSSASYDWRNLPSQMLAGSQTLSYDYNADGNRTDKRIGSTVTHYVRGKDGKVLATYVNNVVKSQHIYAGGEMIGNYDRTQRRYFLKDHLGSIRTTVNESGAVVGYDDYYPFGLVMPGRSSNSANPNDAYKFTGHERDEEAGLTLDYMMARNYDPMIGRFLQIDPLASQFPAWSPYSYTFNNPLRFTDPTGMAPLGDYFNGNGDYLGNDGIDDDKVYIANRKQSGNVKKALKNGDAATAQGASTEVPGVSVLDESLNVLDRTVANGGLSEEASLVMNDGGVVRGKTGEAMKAGDATVNTTVPGLPSGASDGDVAALIHSHPTGSIVNGNTVYSSSALQPGPLDPSAFLRFGTNVIVGRLGLSTGQRTTSGNVTVQQPGLGVVIYNRSSQQTAQLSIRTVRRIIEKLK